MTLVRQRLVGLTATLVLAGGAIGLAFWQNHHSEQTQKTQEAAAKVLRFSDPATAHEIALTTPAGSFHLLREKATGSAGDWTITSPIPTRADSAAVNTLLKALAELTRSGPSNHERDLGGADNAKLFGLDPPRFRVTVVYAEGQHETLLAGVKNSFNDSLYIEVEGSGKMSMVGGALEYQLDQNLFKLRDKSLTSFTPAEVLKLEVTAGGKTRYAVERSDGEHWRLTAPRPLSADSRAVAGILSELANVSAAAFVSERATPPELARYRLDQPKVTATITLRQGKPRRLSFSEAAGKLKEARRYATLDAANPIIEITGQTVFDKLLVDADAVRDLHVLAFAREAVRSLTITLDDKSLVFSREQGEGGVDSWRMTAPESARAQGATLSGLVYRLSSLTAKRVAVESAKPVDLARLGLRSRSLSVSLAGGNGAELATLMFGKIEGDTQYVMSAGGTRVDVIDASVSRDLVLDPAAYKEAVADPAPTIDPKKN